MTIRVLVADDQDLVRAGFVLLVDTEPGMAVVGEAADGVDAAHLAQRLRPDVVLMDVRMPGGDGIAATRQITGDPACSGTRVLILTTFDLDEYVFGAVRAGASGFLLKDTRPVHLLAAIRTVAAGDALLTPSATRRLIAEYASQRAPNRVTRDLTALTERERGVLELVGLGLSNDEICARLHISMPTTKTHMSRLLAKLSARDRAQLVIAAYESGLVG
ncbi:MAG TPA: response regulator transcription factor [Rugosimonospora sp.]